MGTWAVDKKAVADWGSGQLVLEGKALQLSKDEDTMCNPNARAC